jgi:LysR family hydrogen peroxide-inducible transcriptional activator
MTLTELRYIAAVARFRHFGRAAEHCFVSQPTLSVGVKKLEEELGVTLFERSKSEVTITPMGERIVEQARRVLEEAELLTSLAQQGQDQLAGQFRLGVIYTIGPFLIPYLLTALRKQAPRLKLILKEGFTDALLHELRDGGLDAVLLALPVDTVGIATRELYEESFMVAVAADHPWAKRDSIAATELENETMLLLSAGNCFRDQVIEACPGCLNPAAGSDVQRALEGSSIATLRQMAAAGVGVTVVPATSTSLHNELAGLLVYRPFSPPQPRRTVAIAHRQTFPRPLAIDALERVVRSCAIPKIEKI